MARLPTPGGDNGNWGTVLNDYLSQALKPDGTIKDNSVTNAALAADAVDATSIADGSITADKFSASTLVTESEGLASSDNDTSIPTTAAVIDALSTQAQDITAISSRRSLADFMHPYVAGAIYPPSDITSYSTDTTIPSYTGRYSIAFNNVDAALRWRFSGKWYDFSNNGLNSINGATPNDPASWTSFEVEFYLSGDRFALWSVTSGTPSDYRIYVDDMPLTPDWELNSSTPYDTNYMKVQFATSRVRRIRIMMSGLATFTGIFLPGTSDVWAAPKRFRAAIIGDSYIQGGHYAGAGEAYLQAAALPNQLAVMTGWEVLNMGQGSTGYTANGSNIGGKDYYGSSSRMAALAALPALDLVIVYGSGNDSAASSGTLTTAANNLWNAIKAARPSTPIVVAGVEPGSIAGFNDSLMNSSNAVLKAAALANPNVAGFVDMRDTSDPWMVGTGNAGTPNNTGNADFFISMDTVHPTRAGYYNMTYKMVEALRKIRV